jgi:mannosyl-oligosaccharide alpha-1,3-glucosidase
VFVTATGVVRVQISEDVERWQPADILQEEGLKPGKYTALDASDAAIPAGVKNSGQKFIALQLHSEKDDDVRVLVVYTASLRFELYHSGVQVVAVNERNLMHFEKTQSKSMLNINNDDNAAGAGGARSLQGEESSGTSDPVKKDKHQGKEIVGYGEDGLALYADGTQEVKDSELESDELEEEDIDVDGEHVDANARKLLNEHNWEERFQSHTDSRPHGPMSVGVDFSFPFTNNVYGIPEHAAPLNLPPSVGAGSGKHYDQPYRMYNLDVFEYELDNTMALYGNIPFMLGHGVTGSGADVSAVSAALFWFNPSETFIDVNEGKGADEKLYKQTHWLSESGLIDFFMFSGVESSNAKPASALSTATSPGAHAVATTNTGLASVYYDYSLLTGFTALPPLFALGYHQCRWNYRDEKDVAAVESKFEELDFPMDVIWLDIEHTDGKRYFTWDKNLFQTPKEMQEAVAAHGRRMVTIVDPHIKRDNQ